MELWVVLSKPSDTEYLTYKTQHNGQTGSTQHRLHKCDEFDYVDAMSVRRLTCCTLQDLATPYWSRDLSVVLYRNFVIPCRSGDLPFVLYRTWRRHIDNCDLDVVFYRISQAGVSQFVPFLILFESLHGSQTQPIWRVTQISQYDSDRTVWPRYVSITLIGQCDLDMSVSPRCVSMNQIWEYDLNSSVWPR